MALLANRGMALDAQGGGSERSFREDVQLLSDAGIVVETWAPTPYVGPRPASHHVLDVQRRQAGRLVTYLVPFLRGSRGAVRLAYNTPAAAALGGRTVLLRHAWLDAPPRYATSGPLAGRFRSATHLFPSAGALRVAHPSVRDNAIVLPNAVDLEHFQPGGERDGPFRFAFAGRWATAKGLDVLLDAWPAVRAALPTAELHVAGGAEVWPSIRPNTDLADRVRAMRDQGVIEVGVVARADLPSFWHTMDVSVTPSSWVEVFGNTALEALACGIPAIVTDSGGLPEVIGDAGVVVPRADARALADAMVGIVDRARSLRRVARAQAERFDPRTRQRALVELVTRVAGR